MCIHVCVYRWVGMYSLLKKLVCVCVCVEGGRVVGGCAGGTYPCACV